MRLMTVFLAMVLSAVFAAPAAAQGTQVGYSADETFTYVGGTFTIVPGPSPGPTWTGLLECDGGLVSTWCATFDGVAVVDHDTFIAFPVDFVPQIGDVFHAVSDETCELGVARVVVLVDEDPLDGIDSLIQNVLDLNLANGISNALDSKLDNAFDALMDTVEGNDGAAVNMLYAFINAVSAQAGNQISEEDADMLIAAALDIIDLLEES